MKVLWVSAGIFDDADEKQSGVWQKALVVKLAEVPGHEFGNVSYQSFSSAIVYNVYKNIKQWGIPRQGRIRNGMPPKKVCSQFLKIVDDFDPDIIQVWGSENPFKLLPFRTGKKAIRVLTMQGVLGSISSHILRGLSVQEILSAIGIREILTNISLLSIRRFFQKEAKVEQRMLNSADFILTQSEWTESQITPLINGIGCFRVRRVLRNPFLQCDKWTMFTHPNPIVYSASWGYSLKATHILIKAISIVKETVPDVELRIAGATGRRDWLMNGYLRLILRMIRRLGLESNVKWLGAIDATTIVKHLQEASVFVNTSFVESYSLVLAEAMSVGTPCVVSYAGAMPELADPGKEALFFSPGDYKQCAHQILKLLKNSQLAHNISTNAIQRSNKRENGLDYIKAHFDTYEAILRHKSRDQS